MPAHFHPVAIGQRLAERMIALLRTEAIRGAQAVGFRILRGLESLGAGRLHPRPGPAPTAAAAGDIGRVGVGERLVIQHRLERLGKIKPARCGGILIS